MSAFKPEEFQEKENCFNPPRLFPKDRTGRKKEARHYNESSLLSIFLEIKVYDTFFESYLKVFPLRLFRQRETLEEAFLRDVGKARPSFFAPTPKDTLSSVFISRVRPSILRLYSRDSFVELKRAVRTNTPRSRSKPPRRATLRITEGRRQMYEGLGYIYI